MSAWSGNPKITVVTIAKDNPEGLTRTMKSITNQDIDSWKVLLVVPQESHETYCLAREYANSLKISLVEDSGIGIYEAMNVALQNLDTEYVWFMNGGDIFFSHSSMKFGLEVIESSRSDLIIGRHSVMNGAFVERDPAPRYLKRIGAWWFAFNRKRGCHQAMIFRTRKIADLGGFDTRFRLAADFDLVLRMIDSGSVYATNLRLATVEPGGVADLNLSRVFSEKHIIRKTFFDSYWATFASLLWNYLATAKGYLKGNQSFRARK